ncbi:MAG: hypothetical protein ACKO13_12280 [Cytophagales bacterium]
MARVKSNVLIEGFSGRLDNLLFKQYRHGTVISKMPDRSKVKLSTKQKKANKHFQEAVKYAQQVMKTPALHKQYTKAVKKGQSLYHAALSDFLKQSKNGMEAKQ